MGWRKATRKQSRSSRSSASRRRAARRSGRRMQFESLETRQMMAADVFYFSVDVQRNLENSDGSVLVADDADIVKLTVDEDGSYRHETFFDGSDVQLTQASEGINAFALLPNNELLLVTDGRHSVSGAVGDDEDILRFSPTRTGSVTRGAWSTYFDGSDVGLGPNTAGVRVGIDGLSVLNNGQLVISLDSNSDFPLAGLNVADEDLLLFDPAQTGATTRGSWTKYFDGSDVQLADEADPKREDINAVHVVDQGRANPLIYMSAVTELEARHVMAESEDVTVFRPTRLGATTTGRFTELLLDGSRYGLDNAGINAFALAPPAAVSLPELTINDVRHHEGDRGITRFEFTVTPSSASTLPMVVDYATVDGTATVADRDYVARKGRLRWTPGDATPKTISISVRGDTKLEPTERFFVDLSNAQNATIADRRGVGTIVSDNVNATPSIRINNVRQQEGDAGFTRFVFTVIPSGASSQPMSVNYATVDSTARVTDRDYVRQTGRLSWPAGSSAAKTITVSVRGDTKVEPTERFFVDLSNPQNATLADRRGVGTIVNDDVNATPSIRINNVRQLEGDRGLSQFVFTVSLSGTPSEAVRVNYRTADRTATVADRDYIARSGTLQWAAGDSSPKTISIPVRGDLKVEPNEQFVVNLSNPRNATLADRQGLGTIHNQDSPPAPAVAETLYYSLSRERDLTNSDGSRVRVKPEDILKLTRFRDGTFRHEIHFDGSNVGLDGEDIKAATVLSNGDLLVAIEGEPRINGQRVFDEDILRFRPTSLGENRTRGSWSMYFDGSEHGLGPNTAGIRTSISSLSVLPDGDLVVSLGRPVDLPRLGAVEQRDLVRFTPNPRPAGRNPIISGTWSRYLDGSDVQLQTSSEAINALTLRPRNNNDFPDVVFSTAGRAVVNEVAHASEDLLSFLPSRLGATTRGAYRADRVLDGTDVGINFGDLDAVFEEIGRM